MKTHKRWVLMVALFVVTGQHAPGQQIKPLATLPGHEGGTSALAFASDGRMLASGSRRGVVKLWEVETGRERATLGDFADTVCSLSLSREGGKLRVVARHRVSLDRGRVFGTDINAKPHELDGGDCGPCVWEVRSEAIPTGQPCIPPGEKGRLPLRGAAGAVYAVARSPDGRTEVAAERGGTITLWETASGKQRAAFKSGHWGIRCVAFSSDGKQLASGESGSWGTICLWELGTDKPPATLKGHSGSVYSVAFARGDKLLASAGADGQVLLFDPRRGARMSTLKFGKPVYAVAFSPDGRLLATGGYQGKIQIWSVAQLLAQKGPP